MTTQKQPPTLAVWLLKHFGSGPDNEALLGDLAEQYAEKNSAVWYWRQVMGGIVISFFKELRGHKWIALRALLIGWVVWFAFVKVIPPPPLALFFGNRALHSFLDALAMSLLLGTLCGWLVAHLHRNQRTAVVLLFAATVTFQQLQFLRRIIFYEQPLAIHMGLTPHLYANFAAGFVASLFGILLGGGLLRNHSTNGNAG